MRIRDEKTLSLEIGSSYTSETCGIVLKTQDDIGTTELGVFIPKLMPAVELGQNGSVENTVTLDIDKCINSEQFVCNDRVISRNWLKVPGRTLGNASPPKYMRGDIVFVSFVDSDIKSPYYDVSSVNYNGHKNVDNFRTFVPASPQPNVVITKDNSYYIELDSLKDKQRVIISTSNANGEKCKHYLLFDSKNGVLSLTDESRSVTMSYDDDTIVLKNEKDSTIILNKDEITISAKTINIKASGKLNIETPETVVDSDKTTYDGKQFEMSEDKVSVSSKSVDVSSTTETHDITDRFVIKGTGKTHINHTLIGLNGETVIRNFVIGMCPDINIPVPKVNGDSGPPGTSIWSTGAGSMPLVKYNSLTNILIMMCSYIDMAMSSGPVPLPPAAVASVTPLLTQLPTTTILAK